MRALLAIFSFFAVIFLVALAGFLLASASTEEVIVPDVKGLEMTKAQVQLGNAGLGAKVIEERGPDTAMGKVIRTVPSIGSVVKKGRVVRVYVGAASLLIPVPNLVGLNKIHAENVLRRAGIDFGPTGLVLGAVAEIQSDSPPGTILHQTPGPDTLLPPGSAITIVVAKGQMMGVMPNVMKLDIEAARALLAENGIAYTEESDKKVVTEKYKAGSVILQLPSPGKRMVEGVTVVLTVAMPPPAPGNAIVPQTEPMMMEPAPVEEEKTP